MLFQDFSLLYSNEKSWNDILNGMELHLPIENQI